jgi:hypothetical protein
MGTKAIETSPRGLASSRRQALTLEIKDEESRAIRPASAWCATCAREVEAGPVLSRGSIFCSPECAATSTLPGQYLG